MNKVICAFSLLALLSCSSQVAGGGSSGTEAGNALTAVVLNTDGTPAVGARAHLRKQDYVVGDTSAQKFDADVGASGTVNFAGVPQGQWALEVTTGTHALLRKFEFANTDSSLNLPTDTLYQVSTISGSVPLPILPGTKVAIAGTEHFAVPNENGHFELGNLPSGFIKVEMFDETGNSGYAGYANSKPGQQLPIGPLATEVQSLLLEDFEDGDSQHRYAAFTNGGWWFLDWDSSVVVEPNTNDFKMLRAYDAEKGNVIHFSGVFDSLAQNPWVDCGMQIGLDSLTYDLSGVDSLVFWAKGSGSVFVMLHYSVLQASEPKLFLNLSATWQRVSIPMDSITIAGATDPKALRTAVRAISWVFSSGSFDFWLDDISLIGATKEEIWK